MTLSRRNFLTTALGSAVCLLNLPTPALLSGVTATPTADESLKVQNYRRDKAFTVDEGQTLLAMFSFAEPLRTLDGSLPMQIEPAALGGDPATEPQPLSFYQLDDTRRRWATFLTAPLDVIPQNYPLQLNGITNRNLAQQWQVVYQARQGVYRNAFLTLSKEFSAPSKEIVALQRANFQETLAALAQRSPRQWSENFILPTKGGYRNNYGDRRTVNRVKRYRHAGIDMRAAIGTPVRAMNDGIIALSANHWAPGQNIILNHGGGIFSKYIHLSRREVNTGDKVKRGDVIALSGNTGGQKVGPHLHLDIFANGAAVNPIQFMSVVQQFLALDPKQTTN